MVKKKHVANLGAPDAVTGYGFQFVWTARRCLSMLNPTNTLRQVVAEGIHPDDLLDLGSGPEKFIGVDLTEYHGTTDLTSASKIVLSQLKCGVSAPSRKWTISRLCTGKKGKPETSVIRRLANAFGALTKNDTLKPADLTHRVVVQLVSNCPLDHQTASLIKKAQKTLMGANCPPERLKYQTLSRGTFSGPQKTELLRLYRTAGLSSNAFALFLLCFDLSSFSVEAPAMQSVRAFQETVAFDGIGPHTTLARLCNLVVDAAKHAPASPIRRADVLACMDTSPEEFSPAPCLIHTPDSLIVTRDAETLVTLLVSGEHHKLIAHGRAGVGKSVTVMSLLPHLPSSSKVIVYDCYGRGETSTPNRFRYPAATACTQIANEVSLVCATDVYVIRNRVDRRELWARLQRSIEDGARALMKSGGLLIIVIDAADNAALSYTGDTSAQREECFLRHMWGLQFPRNVRLVMTCRTHRRDMLEAPAGTKNVALQGFSQENSLAYLQTSIKGATDASGIHFHRATAGTPRLQYYWLKALASLNESDALAQIAGKKAFGLIDEYADWLQAAASILPPRIGSIDAVSVLVAAGTGTPFDVFADALHLDQSTVTHFLQGLEPGVMTGGNVIQFRDEDFETFLRESVDVAARKRAHERLADHCLRNLDRSVYAVTNASNHLLRASRNRDLIHLALRGDGLKTIDDPLRRGQIEADTIARALTAAQTLRDSRAVGHLLFEMGRLRRAEGTSKQLLVDFPEEAISHGRYDALISACQDRLDHNSLGRMQFRIAAEVSKSPQSADLAREHLARGEAWLRGHIATVSKERWSHLEYDVEDSVYYALAVFRLQGLGAAENTIRRWRSNQKRLETAYKFFKLLTQTDGISAAIKALRHVRGLAVVHAACYAGILEGGGRLPQNELSVVLRRLILWASVHPKSTEVLGLYIVSFFEGCAIAGVSKKMMASGLAVVKLPPLEIRSEFISPRFWDASWDSHMRVACLKAALLGAEAQVRDMVGNDPRTVDMLEKTKKERAKRYGYTFELDTLSVIEALFPIYRLRAASYVARRQARTLGTRIDRMIGDWEKGTSDFWYKGQPYYSLFVNIATDTLVRCPGTVFHVVEALLAPTAKILKALPLHVREDVCALLEVRDDYVGLVQDITTTAARDYQAIQGKASETASALMRCSRTVLRIDPAGSRDYFEKAIAAAEGIDEDAPDLLKALSRAAVRSTPILDPESRRRLATSMSGAIRSLYPRFNEEHHIPWDHLISGIAALDSCTGFDAALDFYNSGWLPLEDEIAGLITGLSAGKQVAQEYICGLHCFADIERNAVDATLDALAELRTVNPSAATACLVSLIRNAMRDIPNRARADIIAILATKSRDFNLDPPVIKELDEALAFYSVSANWQSGSRTSTSPLDAPQKQKHRASLVAQLRASLLSAPTKVPTLVERIASESSDTARSAILRVWESLRGNQRRLLIAHLMDMKCDAYSSLVYLLPDVLAHLITDWDRLGYDKAWLQTRLAQFIEANLGALFSYGHDYDRGVKVLLDHPAIPKEARADILMPALVKYAARFSAPLLYELAGMFASSLPPKDAGEVLSRALGVMKNDIGIRCRSIDEHRDGGLCRFLCACFGHHDNRLRWRAFHTARSMISIKATPLLSELMRMSHAEQGEMWMSMRVWLLFLFRHLSIAAPEILLTQKKTLLWHAFNQAFPHAGIRELAKQSLLQLEAWRPGQLTMQDKEKLRCLNSPLSCPNMIARQCDSQASVLSPRPKQKWRFDFDSIDTLPYWYAPLGRCFGLHEYDVAKRAEIWICDKWGITSETCLEYDRQRFSEYDWRLRDHHHSSLPIIESLRTYVERHAMFMAASEMISELPVVADGDDDPGPWEEWIRRNSFEADPCITADIRRPVPLLSEFHGVLPDGVDDGLPTQLMLQHLLYKRGNEAWFVVAGDYHLVVRPASYYFSIDSALVSPATANALGISMLTSEEQFSIEIPTFKIQYAQYLYEAESQLRDQTRNHSDADAGESHPGFILRPWIAHYYSEFDAHSCDPRWRGMGRSWHLLGPDATQRLGLTRPVLDVNYFDGSDRRVAFAEVWRDQPIEDRTDENSSNGNRLHIREAELLTLMKEYGLDLIIRLAVSRNYYGAKDYEEKGKPYDQTQIVIVRQTGEVERLAGDCRPRKEHP